LVDVFPREGWGGAPEYPGRAKRDGTSGTVVAKIKVVNCNIDVTIAAGPRVFHDPVIKHIKQYKCVPFDEELVFTQEFTFNLDQ
jgi:hypothetical protein